ncbi:B box and SPRY domain-containing protein [Spea bombifrons]|uniref:B box and SPRY domain-containing protein n=1 Tax=Spea bombifrons TaxID=233779 RepID=UPI002349F46B|nr:B box and SPRY domain-containing protein [Spea bombifrons]
MSQPGTVSGDTGLPVWAITGSQAWGGSEGQEPPFAPEWLPEKQLATLSLNPAEEEDVDLGDAPKEMPPTPAPADPQQPLPGQNPVSDSGCREHGGELSWFCCQELRLICPECRTRGSCQSHRTKPAEERAAQLRNKIVDQCEKLQLQTAGIEKYLAEALPAKIPRVASTARAARELVIQRLIFIRNVCENEEQRLLEEVHAEEERAQQGILTQRAHWTESARKLSSIRTYLVDMLTKLDDVSLINSANEMEERTEEAEGILEPQESEKLNFNPGCVQSPLLNRLWASSVLCCTTVCEELTLDEKTISPLLLLSEGNVLTFLQKKAKSYPDGPERFNHWPNCFAANSFQSGIHAWKVNVESSCAYKLGVAYGSLARKGSGNDARLGYNAASWVFSRYDKDFRFSHDSRHDSVELLRGPKHVGVLLDLDGGELIFFDPGSCVVLYSHRVKFAAPVFPVFAVADDSIRLVK